MGERPPKKSTVQIKWPDVLNSQKSLKYVNILCGLCSFPGHWVPFGASSLFVKLELINKERNVAWTSGRFQHYNRDESGANKGETLELSVSINLL